MHISEFFEPIDLEVLQFNFETSGYPRMGNLIRSFTDAGDFPDYQSVDIAIIGVREDRNAVNNSGCALAPDYIRKYFYNLFPGVYEVKIADLGNIRQGYTIQDTFFAVSSVITELVQNNIVPVLIGGSQDLTFANYQAYRNLGQVINIVAVDSMLDIGRSEEEVNSQS